MIDLHCHLLPGVDDGAASLDDAAAMLRQAEADGIQTVVITPHVFNSLCLYRDLDSLRGNWQKWLPALRGICPGLQLITGAEVYFSAELPGLLKEQRDLMTINNGSYFLLEFPGECVYSGSKEFIFTVLSDGFIPIISHPERNGAIQRSPRLLHELVKGGALCQVNAGSLRGDFGPLARQTALDLLAGNWVHVIASDAHNPRSRRLELSFVRGLLRHIAPEKMEFYLNAIPAAIIADEAIPDIGEPRQRLPRRSFFDLFKKETS